MGVYCIKCRLIICSFLLLELFAILVTTADILNTTNEQTKQEGFPFPWFPDDRGSNKWDDRWPTRRPRPTTPRPRPTTTSRPPPPPPCSTVKSCAQCVNIPCAWSLTSGTCNSCSIKRDKTCKTWSNNNTLITSENKRDIKCPFFKNDDKTIYIPSGSNRTVVVKVDLGGVKDSLILLNYRCVFKIEDKNVEVNAKLLSNTIYCDSTMFSYDSSTTTLSVPMTVYAGNNGYFLENPDNISLEIFKCSEMGKSCKSCVSNQSKYNCAWCEKKKSCEASVENCDDPMITDESICK